MDSARVTQRELLVLPAKAIDRESPIPLYFQLKELLAAEITSGRWPPGVRIPSEPEIGAHFEVSRTTVRQTLDEMESDGLISRVKGRGTFVKQSSPDTWFLQSSQGFYDEATAKGHKVTSRVLRREVGKLPAWALEALGLEAGAHGLTLERLRLVDGRVVMYVVNHLPEDLADLVIRADLERGSLYGALREGGVEIGGGYRVVEAVKAEGELARLLEIEDGAPLLHVQSVTRESYLRPVECYQAWHRADRTKIEVRVVPEDVASQAGVADNIRWG